MTSFANHPATGKAGIARRLTVGHQWPGLPEPGRWADAEHAETVPGALRAVISPLACALVEALGTVRLVPGTRIAAAYRRTEVRVGYRCRYGLNPQFQAALLTGPMRAAAADETGAIRAVEIDGHPFFVATLFQPERAALKGETAPLITAFLAACGQ